MHDPKTSPPPEGDYARLLGQAASLWGIEPGYHDVWGQWHAATPEIQRSLLASLGVPANSWEELRAAVDEKLRHDFQRLVPLVHVTGADKASLPLNLPETATEAEIALELFFEDGSTAHHRCLLSRCAAAERHIIGEDAYLQWRVRLPSSLPFGYHSVRVAVHCNGSVISQADTTLIVGPDRAHIPAVLRDRGRRAGLAVSLYGVHSEDTWGCGDFTALDRLTDWVAGQVHGSYLALNPLNSIHNRQPYNTSHYLPNSVFYRNFIYLDIDRIEEMRHSRPAEILRNREEVLAEIKALNESEFVEYERVAALKLRFLKLLFRTFLSREVHRDTPRAHEFVIYVEQEGESLDRYALYCALDEWLHRRDPDVWTWPQWPEEYQDPNSAACVQFKRLHPRAVLFHKYVQWLIDCQLEDSQVYARRKGMEIGLFHDLPLATDSCGSDLWAYRDFYIAGCRVGAPPDEFSPNGQDWSFPPPNVERHRDDGYRLFAKLVRRAMRHSGALRMDHVMRLFRLYWIPRDKDPRGGAYVKNPAEDLLRVIALESVRNQVLVVGEDLGTVEPHVRETLARFGILSYRLFYFERHGDGRYKLPHEYPTQALVSSTTHDLPTLAGYWAGRDIDVRRAAGALRKETDHERLWKERQADKQRILDLLFDLKLVPDGYPPMASDLPELSGEIHNGIVGFLVSTPSMLMTLNQEDLTKETEQQNLPGTVDQYPNWRRKMKYSIEDLWRKDAMDFAAMFRQWLDSTGRRIM